MHGSRGGGGAVGPDLLPPEKDCKIIGFVFNNSGPKNQATKPTLNVGP